MVPNVAFSGYGFVPLLPGARTATPVWQELSGVGILQRLGSERASSRLDLAPSESCLLQCQNSPSRGCICAPPELGLTSLGPEEDSIEGLIRLKLVDQQSRLPFC